jgi:hypothetical protein
LWPLPSTPLIAAIVATAVFRAQEPRSAMVPLIIALPRALHFWTRAACHRRKVSKLRAAVRVAKIVFGRHRWTFRTKVTPRTDAFPEIGKPTLLRAEELSPFTPALGAKVTPWSIEKFAARTHIGVIPPRRSFS